MGGGGYCHAKNGGRTHPPMTSEVFTPLLLKQCESRVSLGDSMPQRLFHIVDFSDPELSEHVDDVSSVVESSRDGSPQTISLMRRFLLVLSTVWTLA